MLLSFFRRQPKPRVSQKKRAPSSLSIERLEDRIVPAMADAVTNLYDSGLGSLRSAIVYANAHPGQVIDFEVAGTINLTSGALPALTSPVDIDGTTAPGYGTNDTPTIEVNFNTFAGLQFNAGATGSDLKSLSLVNAGGIGVLALGASNMTITGNYIGLALDGTTSAANGSNGLQLSNSSGDTVGGDTAPLRNLISANRGNGIVIDTSTQDHVMGNYIGTDVTGNLRRGNGASGILLSNAATGNIIGGTEYTGNDPAPANTPPPAAFVRPPQGNLISGNLANGVLINNLANNNFLYGNFIGTTLSGDAPLGNSLDGVDILGANGTSLIGSAAASGAVPATVPFAYYNVISGNGANGLQVTNCNNTVIQGDFFGLGANNQTPVGNALNGVVVEGESANTLMGGAIPLGNVVAANRLNGLVVQGQTAGFTSYNTFCGLAAFQTYTGLGNGNDGMLVTSTGNNILLRTNVITENHNDGVEIGGAAQGVIVSDNIIGLSTNGQTAMGNQNNGVEVDGSAHGIIIGSSSAPSIIPYNVISANGNDGIDIDGSANNVQVNFSYIGTSLNGQNAIGNGKAGVLLDSGSSANTIGSTSSGLLTIISGNVGDGVEMRGTNNNTVVGAYIGVAENGNALGNGGDGIFINNSSNNHIGSLASTNNKGSSGTNLIAYNDGNGVYVDSGTGNAIHDNSIYDNDLLGIELGPWANMNQVAPALGSITEVSSSLRVSGTLNSAPNTTYTLEFFASDSANASGQYFLGALTVKTNVNGYAAFTFTYDESTLPNGAEYVTATATDPNGNTSAFSASVYYKSGS